MGSPYGFGTTLHVPYEEAIPRVKEALKAECMDSGSRHFYPAESPLRCQRSPGQG